MKTASEKNQNIFSEIFTRIKFELKDSEANDHAKLKLSDFPEVFSMFSAIWVRVSVRVFGIGDYNSDSSKDVFIFLFQERWSQVCQQQEKNDRLKIKYAVNRLLFSYSIVAVI